VRVGRSRAMRIGTAVVDPHSTEALIAALEYIPGDRVGRRRIVAIDRVPNQYSTSFAIEDLAVTFDDGRTDLVLFKDIGGSAMLDGARRAKPAFVFDHRRE